MTNYVHIISDLSKNSFNLIPWISVAISTIALFISIILLNKNHKISLALYYPFINVIIKRSSTDNSPKFLQIENQKDFPARNIQIKLFVFQENPIEKTPISKSILNLNLEPFYPQKVTYLTKGDPISIGIKYLNDKITKVKSNLPQVEDWFLCVKVLALNITKSRKLEEISFYFKIFDVNNKFSYNKEHKTSNYFG